METLSKIFSELNNSDRVKVILPSGIYLQGRKKKVQRDIQQLNSELEVSKTEIAYTSIPFRVNLCKEVVIYTSWKKAAMNTETSN